MMLTAPSPAPTFCIMSAVAIPEYAEQIAAAATDNKNVLESAIVSLPARSHLLAGTTAPKSPCRIRIAGNGSPAAGLLKPLKAAGSDWNQALFASAKKLRNEARSVS